MSEMAGVVVFKNANGPGLSEDEQAPDERAFPAGYLRSREIAERAAAKRAQSTAARQAHQELAQHYAELARSAR